VSLEDMGGLEELGPAEAAVSNESVPGPVPPASEEPPPLMPPPTKARAACPWVLACVDVRAPSEPSPPLLPHCCAHRPLFMGIGSRSMGTAASRGGRRPSATLRCGRPSRETRKGVCVCVCVCV
jgi:hypothetical protein